MNQTVITLNQNTTPYEFEAALNAAFSAGEAININGRKVVARFPGDEPAHAYQNGTVGVNVEGRKPGAVGTEFIKKGEKFTIEM